MEDYICSQIEESRIEFKEEMRELQQHTKSQFSDIKSQFDEMTGKLDAIIDLLPNWLRSNGIEPVDLIVPSDQVTDNLVDDLLEIDKSLDSDLYGEEVSVAKQSWIDSDVHRADNRYSVKEECIECIAEPYAHKLFDEMSVSIQAALPEEQLHTKMAQMHTKMDFLLDGTFGDVQPSELKNVSGPLAYQIFDEMAPTSRAVVMNELRDPYIGGIHFNNITLFDPGGDRKYVMSSSKRGVPELFDKALETSDNGLEGVDWGIFSMEGDAYNVFDEPGLTEAATFMSISMIERVEFTSLKAGVWLMEEFMRIHPSKNGMATIAYHVFDKVSKPLPMKIYLLSARLNMFNEMPNQIFDLGGSSLHYVGYATKHSLDLSKVKHDYDTISSDLQKCKLWGVSLQWLKLRRQKSDYQLFHDTPELIVVEHTEDNGGLKSCKYLVVCNPNYLRYEANVPEFIFTFDPGGNFGFYYVCWFDKPNVKLVYEWPLLGTVTTFHSVGLAWEENEIHRSINLWIGRVSSWYEHGAIGFCGKQRSQSMMQQSGSQQSSFIRCSKIGCNFFDETSKPASVDLQENVYGGAMRRNEYELLILATTRADNIDEFSVSISLMINEIAGLSNHNIRFVMLFSLGHYISVLFLDGVLWVHMIDFTCMSKLEFNPQVYDPGTGAYLVGILAHSVRCCPFDPGGNLVYRIEGNILKTYTFSFIFVIIQRERFFIYVWDTGQCALIVYILEDKDGFEGLERKILAMVMIRSIKDDQTDGKCGSNKACKTLRQLLFLVSFSSHGQLFCCCLVASKIGDNLAAKIVIHRTSGVLSLSKQGQVSNFELRRHDDEASCGLDCILHHLPSVYIPASFFDVRTNLNREFLRSFEDVIISIINDYVSLHYLPCVSAAAALIYVMRNFEPCKLMFYQNQLMDGLKLRSVNPVTVMKSWMLYVGRISSESQQQQLPFCFHLVSFLAFQNPCYVLGFLILMLWLVDYKGSSCDLGSYTILALENSCLDNIYSTSIVAYTNIVLGAENEDVTETSQAKHKWGPSNQNQNSFALDYIPLWTSLFQLYAAVMLVLGLLRPAQQWDFSYGYDGAKLEILVWDPGIFLDLLFHCTTLRTRRFLRGRICHVSALKIIIIVEADIIERLSYVIILSLLSLVTLVV